MIHNDLAVSVVNALTSSICVLDRAGNIVGVNRAWADFSAENGGERDKAFLGANYLDVCERSAGPASEGAAKFHKGLRDVLEGRTGRFELEYPCHSPAELRWFLARVTPLFGAGETSGEITGAVVSHMSITDRKLLELRYSRLASTDALTELPNRRFFEESAAIELGRLRRFGGTIALLMMDLDNFKSINDHYGHLAGDAVLKKVAASCRSVMRDADLFARLGGEEFVALLLDSDEAAAILLAERIRSKVAELSIKTPAGPIHVTSSIGVSAVTAKDHSIAAALHRADKALYAAKHAGKNRVEVAA